MRWRLLVFSSVMCALCCAAIGFPLKGKVVDTNGKPVAGIKIDVTERAREVWDSKAVIRETVFTDAAGAFKLKDINLEPSPKKPAPPTLTFVAHEPGRLLGWRMVHVGYLVRTGKTDELAKGITIVVAKPGMVEGKVTDESGKPIAGARIECQSFAPKKTGKSDDSYAIADDLSPAMEFPDVLTDTNGDYHIANIPGNVTPHVYVSKQGLAMKPTADGAPPSMDVVMVAGGSMSGRVVNGNGKGVSGALVTMSSYSMSGNSSGWGKAISDNDGSFTIDGLVPGEYRITTYPVREDHIQLVRSGVRIKAGETAKLPDIISPPSVYITGRVIDVDSGKPIPDAEISVGSEQFYGPRVTSDKQGNYRVPVLPAEVRISYAGGNPMYLPDWRSNQKPISVPATGLKGHIIKLKSNGRCKGVVVGPDGKPLTGIAVSVGAEPEQVKCVTNGKGEFALGLPPKIDLSGG